MPSFEISIKGVQAANSQQAQQVKESLITIVNSLTAQEVIDLAILLKEKPGIVQKAKQFRNFF